MHRTQLTLVFLFVFGLGVFASPGFAQEAEQSAREAMYYRYLEFASYVKGGSIEPHWMADGSSFWYAEGAPDNTVIYKVDPKANTKTPLFDTARLRQALTPTLGHEPPYKGLPFEEFTFVDENETAVSFTVEDKVFVLLLDSYAITRAPIPSEEEKMRQVPRVTRNPSSWGDFTEVLSPDRRWFVGVKDNNLWLRSTSDGRSIQLTTDGIKDYWWDNSEAKWAPSGPKLAVTKVDFRGVRKVPIVHYLKPREEVEWVYYDYAKPGERIPRIEPFIMDIRSKRQIRIETGKEPAAWIDLRPGWRPDGSELFLLRMNREGNKLDLLAADPQSGATRVVLTETQKTFLIGAEWSLLERLFTWLPNTEKFIWLSERDGWNHLYLYDYDGNLIRRLTAGAFPVGRVVAVDEKAGWVYFTAHGDQRRPYDTHLYRVNLDGQRFRKLTEATGQHDTRRDPSHTIRFSPSKEFFLDTHSTVTRPPVVELRRADGKLLQTLSKARIDDLTELKWKPPEEFVVKAADGKTDLWGVLFKPYDFDAKKKYPVIEVIYGGPKVSVVPNTFTGYKNYNGQAPALAQLGFITFILDGRGTPERGKAFQDVVYGNLGRHEIPDHVAALKQLAEERPYMDLSRVGIVGHSWGGYFTVRAMLLAPHVYHVGIASASPAEGGPLTFYMGLLRDNKEAYEYASNLRLADNLEGKLLLIHGTSDNVVPLSDTMKMAEAFIQANKPFDLILIPEIGHRSWRAGKSGTYWREAIRRYFQEHLKP
ncbi:MAG: DPP IV N-terminal domain-containing protein [Planctomycetes bacterium]|nr:DPP IV N-terminal domain-containing protein [Planctomycetota bacterium]